MASQVGEAGGFDQIPIIPLGRLELVARVDAIHKAERVRFFCLEKSAFENQLFGLAGMDIPRNREVSTSPARKRASGLAKTSSIAETIIQPPKMQ